MTQPKPWRPGWRRAGGSYNRLSERTRAIATIAQYRISILHVREDTSSGNDTEENVDYIDDNELLLLTFNNNNKRFAIPLTHFTTQELAVLKEVVDHAFALASPLVEKFDRVAEEAAKNGFDFYARRHRSDPKVSYFPRQG